MAAGRHQFADHEDWVAKRLEARLMRARLQTVTTWVGSGLPRFYLPMDQICPQTNVSGGSLSADLDAVREALRKVARNRWPEFPEVRVAVPLLPNGPPVPTPFSSAWSARPGGAVREG